MNERRPAIALTVHELVENILSEGAKPSDVSFVLTMVATELGLEVTKGIISVFPIILSGVSRGVANVLEAIEVEGVEELVQRTPSEEIVH